MGDPSERKFAHRVSAPVKVLGVVRPPASPGGLLPEREPVGEREVTRPTPIASQTDRPYRAMVRRRAVALHRHIATATEQFENSCCAGSSGGDRQFVGQLSCPERATADTFHSRATVDCCFRSFPQRRIGRAGRQSCPAGRLRAWSAGILSSRRTAITSRWQRGAR